MKKIVALGLVGLFLVSSFAVANRSVGPYDSVADNSYSLQGYSSSSISPRAEWNKTYGGTGNDYAKSIVQTSDGGYAIAGFTYSSGAGASDFWLVKTDALGNMEWNKTYGGTEWDGDEFSGVSVIQTSDEGFALAGTTRSFGAGGSDFWLVKVNSSGNMEWNKTHGGPSYEYFESVIQSSDGGYVLTGGTFDAGYYDLWLVKTDSLGNMQWNKTYGGPMDDFGTSVIQTADGGYAVAGSTYSDATYDDFWLVKTDGFGNLSWSQNYGGSSGDGGKGLRWPLGVSAIETSDGSYLLTGPTWSFGAESADLWLVQVNAKGKMQWSQMYGGSDFESPGSIVSASNGYVVAGTTGVSGDVDYWLVKTDLFGIMQWNQTYGGTSEDFAHCVIQTNDGGYAIVGSTESFGAGGYDFWLIKLRPEEGVRQYYGVVDLNRDGKVDVLDLSELAKAYGSSLVLPSIPNKTVVTVVSFDREPPEVENARVAIIDPEVYKEAVDVNYTSSSGTATFDLSSNKNYTAIAWSGSAYNYANFTTNSLGESSILILLGEPSTPPIRSLPSGWVVVTAENNETGSVEFDRKFVIYASALELDPQVGWVFTGTGDGFLDNTPPYLGVGVIPPNWQFNEPHSSWGVSYVHEIQGTIAGVVYSPDENSCANVVLHVNLP